MAILEEWILDDRVNEALRVRVEAALAAILPEAIERTVTLEDNYIYADVLVPEDDLHDLARELDAPLRHFVGWDWEDDIDELDDEDAYSLRVEIVEKTPETFRSAKEGEPTILSVYSKDESNNAGWPVAFVLASRLTRELGGREPPENESSGLSN